MINFVILFSRFWTIVLLICGLALLLDGINFGEVTEALTRNRGLMPLLFWPVLVVGVANVLLVEHWAPDLAGIVTLIGWLTLLKGAVALLCPSLMLRIVSGLARQRGWRYAAGIVFVIVAVALYGLRTTALHTAIP